MVVWVVLVLGGVGVGVGVVGVVGVGAGVGGDFSTKKALFRDLQIQVLPQN